MIEHRRGAFAKSFSNIYHVHDLVYVEGYESREEALLREKQLKAGSRKKKIMLIESINPQWEDLYTTTDPLLRRRIA